MMIVVGLTGSIGMGKTTTANIFRGYGVCVHDSDAAVHAIYNGPRSQLIEEMFPGVCVDGRVDRTRLASRVLGDRVAMRRLEEAIHPLVGSDRARFLEECEMRGERVAVVDVPLLLEIGGEVAVDVVVVVSAPGPIQRARVLARPGMTVEKFEAISSKQTPDPVKRARAHCVINTGLGIEEIGRAHV